MINKKYKMQANEQQQQQPSVITLNKTNSIQILIQYIEIAQKAGAYELKEAEILKRSVDVLINSVSDSEINENLAVNLLIQGILKGQKHGGAFNLNDAALLQKVIQYIVSLSVENSETPAAVTNETVNQESKNEDDDDLSSLSEPVPLRPKEI